MTDREGKFDQLLVAGADGRERRAAPGAAREVLPRSVRVETAEQNAEREPTRSTRTSSASCGSSCWCSAASSRSSAAFLIFNTFSITVAQRIREFGLLRTLGASRRQILWSVVGESLAIAAVGSLAGLAGGLGSAVRDAARCSRPSASTCPAAGTVLEPSTVVIALAVGMLVTLVAALVPALRATRVTPMAALLEAELPEARERGRVAARGHGRSWSRAAWRCC